MRKILMSEFTIPPQTSAEWESGFRVKNSLINPSEYQIIVKTYSRAIPKKRVRKTNRGSNEVLTKG